MRTQCLLVPEVFQRVGSRRLDADDVSSDGGAAVAARGGAATAIVLVESPPASWTTATPTRIDPTLEDLVAQRILGSLAGTRTSTTPTTCGVTRWLPRPSTSPTPLVRAVRAEGVPATAASPSLDTPPSPASRP